MGVLSFLDYAIVGLYLVATMLIGLWVSRYIQTGREFFLAGRTLPWWAVGVSLVATDIGGTDIIGAGGAAYRHGMAVGNFEWIGCIPAMIVAGFVFIPHFWRCRVTTIPEYLERRFSVEVRTAVALCWLVFMACNLGVMLLASARMMEALANWPVAWSIWGIAILVGIYTYSGGLAAVVYTDVLQGIVMIGGCALVVVIGLWEVGGITGLREKVTTTVAAREDAQTPQGDGEPSPAPRIEHFDLVLPVDTKSPFPWTGILFGLALITSPAYWIGNQAIVQRALGTRSEFEAKASYVWGALLKSVIPIIIVVPGLLAITQFPNLAQPDLAVPKLIGAIMPSGGKGIFLAAFMAALMSSVDSYLNSATTIFTHDIYLRFMRPTADDRRLLFIGRTVTVLLTLWGVFFAFQLHYAQEGIYAIFQTLMSFFNGPAFAVLLAGLVTRWVTSTGALTGFLTGVLTAVTLFALTRLGPGSGGQPLFQVSEPYLYYSIWAFLMTLVGMSLGSYFSRPDADSKLAYCLGGDCGKEPQ